jgi:glutaredoxin 3
MGGSPSRLANGQLEQRIKQLISQNKVVVFSKTTCPYCTRAKRALQEAGANAHVIELDQDHEGSHIQDLMLKMTGASTVPRVFINGRFVGGGDETVALKNSGELSKMLQEQR